MQLLSLTKYTRTTSTEIQRGRASANGERAWGPRRGDGGSCDTHGANREAAGGSARVCQLESYRKLTRRLDRKRCPTTQLGCSII
eukprot:6186874-Pleurochrysis_carterae.AAC.1